MRKFRKDISQNGTSIGYHFSKNRDMLMAATSLPSLREMVKMIFAKENIDTPASRKILFKLSTLNSCTAGLSYIQNVIFSSMGMATY